MIPPVPYPSLAAYHEAVHRLLDEFAWNPWFLNTYWPENEPRIRLVVQVALANASKGRILDLGCANGYVAYLFRELGFEVTGVDAYDDDKRSQLFRRAGIEYQAANLNEINPLRALPPASFDLVFLGEVLEHILNHPAGLLQDVIRVLCPGGLFIFTTPNPSTLANSVRLLRDRYVLWGTRDFLRSPKVEDGKIIDRGNIHYREYPAWLMRDLITEIGLRFGGLLYVRAGVAPTHPLPKRWIKQLLRAIAAANTRLFSPHYVMWASKIP